METLATLLALVGLAGFFGLSIWWAIRAGTKQREQVAARFRGAAESLGADFDPGEASFFRQRPPSLSLTAEGTRVLVDSYVVSSGKSSTTFSRVRCPWALQPGPALHVRKEHVFHGIGKALGMQDLVVGDASFDEAYVIKGPDPATLRRVVDADTRQALLFQLPRWELRADSEEVVMKRIGYTDSVQELVEVVRVALAVASADRRILMRFAKLTDAGVGSDGVSLRFDRSGVTGELRWGVGLPLRGAAPGRRPRAVVGVCRARGAPRAPRRRPPSAGRGGPRRPRRGPPDPRRPAPLGELARRARARAGGGRLERPGRPGRPVDAWGRVPVRP